VSLFRPPRDSFLVSITPVGDRMRLCEVERKWSRQGSRLKRHGYGVIPPPARDRDPRRTLQVDREKVGLEWLRSTARCAICGFPVRICTVEILILHRVCPTLNPMHYEIYSVWWMSHLVTGCDKGNCNDRVSLNTCMQTVFLLIPQQINQCGLLHILCVLQ
jgi:hypothetical protein